MESAEVIIPPCVLTSLAEPQNLPIKIKTSACPWGKLSVPEAISFNDVMSEQLAHELQEKDEGKKSDKGNETIIIDDIKGCGEEVDDCSDDYLLAQILQLEFDKEHDTLLKQVESKYNGTNKVTVSYENYRRLPEAFYSSDDDDDEILEQNAKKHWHNIEQAEKAFQSVGKSGILRQGNVTTTKHDPTVCGRRNAGKLMEFLPGISTGDAGMFDMKISNNVYNALKTYSVAENRRGNKIHEKKEKSTAEKALDEKTHLILYKMINNQTLDSLTGCISTGKEACVYHAWSGLPENESPTPEFAIKVFKTTLNEFQNRDQYIKDDHRFRHRFGKQNPRKTIHMWAEKEMRNLLRMKEAKIPCPDVVMLRKHVLVMSFIGKEMLPAPKLKDVQLPFEDMTIIYDQTIEIMKTLYNQCKLVHADLSEFNLLWHDGQVWVIDVSQAVEITHPRALEFLMRDCINITLFFEKKGILKVYEPKALFTEICGKEPLKNISNS